jgi:hypothetical protein
MGYEAVVDQTKKYLIGDLHAGITNGEKTMSKQSHTVLDLDSCVGSSKDMATLLSLCGNAAPV